MLKIELDKQLTQWLSLQMACRVSLFPQITFTMEEGQAGTPLTPLHRSGSPGTTVHAAESGPSHHKGSCSNKHTDIPRHVFVFGWFSHPRLQAQAIHHCALWRLGKSPLLKAMALVLISLAQGLDLDQLSPFISKTKQTTELFWVRLERVKDTSKLKIKIAS